MSEILPDNENTLNAELSPSSGSSSSSSGGVGDTTSVYAGQDVIPSIDEYKTSQLSSGGKTIAKTAYTIGKKVLSLDVETTGLNPWEYKLIVCSVWDLDEPKSDMVTFASWDEEQLCKDMFAYIAAKKPDVILAFNAKFECRCFITRAMLYHIQAPWIWSSEWHDMLTMLEGGWKNGLSGTMPAGSEENWLKFFFNEVKPFDIEACFEGIRQGRLDEMIIRNRTCVQGQGDMYQLYMYCQSSGSVVVPEEKPSAERIDDVKGSGMFVVTCPVCNARNEVVDTASGHSCWRCHSDIPAATKSTMVSEILRPIEWALVGLSGDKLKAAQAAQKNKKKALELEPVGEGDIGATAMKRLKDIGVVPKKA